MKIGMIGAGFVAKFHERALRSVRDAELAGVYALKGAEALAQTARQDRLGDTKVYNSIAELVRAVDVVCVFAPNFARVEMMRQIAAAVEGGAKLKGIIVEKPLARNLAEADTPVRIAKAIKVPTAYFENQIHMPSVVQARTQLCRWKKLWGRLTWPAARRSTAVRTSRGSGTRRLRVAGSAATWVVTVSPAACTW